jgi:hypothetical protein
MMKTRKGFGLLLFLVLMGTGQGQEQPHNGYWWMDSPDNYKLGFASGYAMAMTSVYDRGSFTYLIEKGDEAIKACMQTQMIPFDFTHIRLGQLAEGVDDFYKDFRNKGIDINLAMRYVRDELKGKSAKELEDELAKWRTPVR